MSAKICPFPGHAVRSVEPPAAPADDAGVDGATHGGGAAFYDLEETQRGLLALAGAAGETDDEDFAEAFAALVRFAEERFALEAALMEKTADPMGEAHGRDHDRLLQQLSDLQTKVETGRARVARAWLADGLPRWLLNHAVRMDGPLAHWLAIRGLAPR